MPDYTNWKAISTTDRFDNGTMRIIFDNDIAVEVIQEKKTDPWPDGTAFAKTAWNNRCRKTAASVQEHFFRLNLW